MINLSLHIAHVCRMLASAAFVSLALVPQAIAEQDESLCGPFDGKHVETSQVAMNLAGVTKTPADLAGTANGKGRIVDLDTVATAPKKSATKDPSEAILALPKNPAGQIPKNYKLGPGAKLASSFFSPVICATVARITGPPGAGLDELVTVVPDSAVVVPNDVYASAAGSITPLETPLETARVPDPYAALQYGLAATGVRMARGLTDGSGVRIALLDSAPDSGHRDLGEIELQPLSENPTPESEAPAVGVHGTLMAGVIRANEDNGFGIAGIAPGADLVAIPICRSDGGAGGRCTIYDLLRGLDLAWKAEAHIVNLSLSGPANPLLKRGVERLDQLGLVVVAAAGNEGVSQERYPAAYTAVIGVGAVDQAGEPFVLSNRGGWVELRAPGVEVLSTVPGSAFAFGNGTSLAAAHVTGVLAVLTSVTKDPKLAKTELFRAAHSQVRPAASLVDPPLLPPVCDILARLGQDCSASSPKPAEPSGDLRASRASRDARR